MADTLRVRWYAHENDLIGGWAVMNVDKPPSECDADAGERDVADFTNERTARHIADLHNAWLAQQEWQPTACATCGQRVMSDFTTTCFGCTQRAERQGGEGE